jgi:hypothetical protein
MMNQYKVKLNFQLHFINKNNKYQIKISNKI